jgi:divalent metal cation (Fe/Co/Zn/Cd) transporter
VTSPTNRHVEPRPVALGEPDTNQLERDECCSGCAPDQVKRGPEWSIAVRRARSLSWLSLAWMTAEGVLGLIAGIAAGSLSLLGWALGSVIEGLASVIVIWRFTGSRTLSETAEARARQAVAVSFFLLAPYLAVAAGRDLLTGHTADSSRVGVAVTAASLLLMPALGIIKKRLGTILDSGATTGEGAQNLLCAAQAGAVLAGLAVTATLGWSWVDPAVALLLAAWAVREGTQTWRGKDCC